MAKSKKTPAPPPSPHVRVGDRVRFRFGLDDAEGVVVEDRGPLAGNGRHLYKIAFRFEIGDDMGITLPASDFIVVKPAGNGKAESETAR